MHDKSKTDLCFWLISALISLALLSGMAWAGDLDGFRGLKGTLKISGGTAHLPVMTEAALRIHTFNPDVYIDVGGGGTSIGIQQVGTGLADIGNSGRALTEAEKKQYHLLSHPLALDGIAVVVHVANPVTALSRTQIRQIFCGKVTNWQALGGADAPIVLYGREEGSATMEVFESKLLGKGVIAAPAHDVSSNGAMRNIIAMDKNGIGFLSIGHLDPTKVKAVTIDGVVPSQQTALNGKYTVSRVLYMNTRPTPSPLTRLFIDYLRSREGAEIISHAGYIPLH